MPMMITKSGVDDDNNDGVDSNALWIYRVKMSENDEGDGDE